jgi:tRNA(Leu) C34 or U34 (ribose-2'-O)-methylase TrmL
MALPKQWRDQLTQLHQEISQILVKLQNSQAKMLEREALDARISPSDVLTIRQLLESLANCPLPSVAKISQLTRLLDSSLHPRELENLLVPIERVLDWDLADDQLLIRSDLDDVTMPTIQRRVRPIGFVLDHLRSAFNVGSIFRLAECVGAEQLYLSGYTPTPDNPKVSKSALGCEKSVAWSHLPSLEIIDRQQYHLIALETAPGAASIYDPYPEKACIFVVGNERFGLHPSLVKTCDEARMIPMIGNKKSLNVAQAAAVAAFEWSRQYELRNSHQTHR